MRKSVENRLNKKTTSKSKILVLLIAILAIVLVAFIYAYLSNSASEVSRYSPSSFDLPAYEVDDNENLIQKASVKRLSIPAQSLPGLLSEAPKANTSSRAPQDCNPATSHTNPRSIDVIVNKKHCMVPIDFTPSLATVTCNGTTGYMQAVAASAFQQLCNAAAKDGLPISITSSFRSYSSQVTTYNYWVAVNGSAASADRVSARPGFSEHQTGFAIDIATGGCALECFGGTEQYTWMQNNAHKYGFVQRYNSGQESITGYSAEPWHYRYVGVQVATDMKNKGTKTLEQYFGVQGGDYR